MYALSLSNGTGFSREVVRLIHELTPSGLARHFVLKLGHPCLAKNPGFSGPAKSARSFASRPGEMQASSLLHALEWSVFVLAYLADEGSILCTTSNGAGNRPTTSSSLTAGVTDC